MCKDQETAQPDRNEDIASDGKYDSSTEHQRVRNEYIKSIPVFQLRSRLQEEAKFLQNKLKTINFVLENLTPELEKNIKVINALNELGHYLR